MSKLEESAFGLSTDEMKQIQYMEVLKRRKTKKPAKDAKKSFKFSEKLSMEAQIAMQLALEDTKNMKHLKPTEAPLEVVPENPSGSESGSGASSSVRQQRPDTSVSSHTSFTELFTRHQSARMSRDITDDRYDEEKEIKRALGGGKLESTMEMVEVVNKDDPEAPVWDEKAILELARTNAVDKCLVWIEASNHCDSAEFEDRELV